MKMTKREQMLECIEEIENRQALLEGHDIWQDELVWWMAKAICLLLREAAIADRDEARAPSKPVVELTGRADAQRGAARWIENGYGDGELVCSYCGEPCATFSNLKPRDRYCKWCGAKMKGEEDE